MRKISDGKGYVWVDLKVHESRANDKALLVVRRSESNTVEMYTTGSLRAYLSELFPATWYCYPDMSDCSLDDCKWLDSLARKYTLATEFDADLDDAEEIVVN